MVKACGDNQDNYNPCLTCGACCALYRASFYWTEADDATPNGVPVSMTRQLTPFRRCMLTTEPGTMRCIALTGIIGARVACAIYERRSSVCRDFVPAWENGEPNERCDSARALFNLQPLTPFDRNSPNLFPKAA